MATIFAAATVLKDDDGDNVVGVVVIEVEVLVAPIDCGLTIR